MSDAENRLRALREAVRIAPDDGALRGMLADALLDAGHAADAEAEYRACLRLSPGDDGVRLALARAFHRQGKRDAALVVVEDAVRGGQGGAAAHLLHARILLDGGELDAARLAYAAALAADPAAADVELAARLGSVRGSASPPAPPSPPPASRAPDEERRVPLRAGNDRDDDEDDEIEVEAERPKIDFGDVGGMEALKEEVRMKVIHPLRHPELYRAYGRSVGGGILMYGPPGCGKTHLARATAGEVDASFLSVGIHEVLDMWIGRSERNLNALFRQARAQAPCVLFFDEVDALASRRSDMRAGAGRPLINQFLAEMDGLGSQNDGVLILAATNAPWHLDPAFRRPGRFDRVLFVPPPDAPARAAVLQVLVRGKPVEAIDFERVAKRTDGFSGADLKAVVDLAVERKLAEAMRGGVPQPLRTADLADAAKDVKPTTREWFATARNYVLYANESGLYDDVKRYL